MIHIDRSSIEPPATLFSKVADSRRNAARLFFKQPESNRTQRRFDFELQFAHPTLRDTLKSLFFGKCAYCEQKINFEPGTAYLDRFRPTHGSIGTGGKVSKDHYWWLAFEWENMFGACSSCNRSKGGLFPVNGRRAPVGAIGKQLNAERHILLDPCKDYPEEHITFTDEGLAAGLTDRGRTTIGIYSLNRPDLVAARRVEAKSFLQRLFESPSLAASIEIRDDEQFVALKRAVAKRHNGVSQVNESVRALKIQKQFDKQLQFYSLADKTAGIEAERSRTRYIDHVSLRNIGVHLKLDISVAEGNSTNAPWYVLLGENGVGKSTLLKAIGFVLAGQSQWHRLGPLATAILPRAGKGTIHISFSDGSSLRTTIDVDQKKIDASFDKPRYRVMGFGATRLLPTGSHRPPVELEYARLTNLFDPFCPLPDATAWLKSLSRLQFDRACVALCELLDLPDGAVFHQASRRILLVHGKHEQDVRELSDGYQTIIGVACAIMSVLLEPDLPVDRAEGIVLIDEMGNHLHPTWRMRIVKSLKHAFPRVQFIATTHEPLCLRGLEIGEAGVLRRVGPHSVALVENLPPAKGLLVDQILSSSYFGLHSTVDEAVGDELDAYYKLLAKSTRSPADEAQLADLQQKVQKYRPVGTSPSEQILLRVIDEHVARAEKNLKPIDPDALPDELIEKLRGLIENVGFSGALVTGS